MVRRAPGPEHGVDVAVGGLAVTSVDALAGVEKLYVHVDLDVLDPAEFAGLNHPEPDGWTISRLVAELDALSGFEAVGAGITECVGTPREVEALEPVLAAIGRLLGVLPHQSL